MKKNSYIQEIVSNSSEPAYSVNDSGQISAWNDAAAEVFGYSYSEAIGKNCWEVMCGHDVFGNQFCGPRCPHLEMAAGGKPIKRCRMHYPGADEHPVEFTLSNLVLKQPSGHFEMLHVARRGDAPIPLDRKIGGKPGPNSREE